MINLDYKSRVPIYEQIVNEIERYVVLGILKPEEQLPSVREMATELGINPNTVKKAYTELERKGVTVTLSTKGTYIAYNTQKLVDEKIEEKLQEIRKIVEEIEQLGLSREEIKNKIQAACEFDAVCGYDPIS